MKNQLKLSDVPGMQSADGADIDGVYRYSLWRRLGPGPTLLWIMLNPSTADGFNNDPTLRRILGFTLQEGYGALEVVNLFAFRSVHPRNLESATDPVGPRNDAAIDEHVKRADAIVVAWGCRVSKLIDARAAQVIARLPNQLHCLGITKGRPRHPLFIPSTKRLEPLQK